MPEEGDDASVKQSEFLLGGWPTDARAEVLPLMNSVLWPLGEQCKICLWFLVIILSFRGGLYELMDRAQIPSLYAKLYKSQAYGP